MRSRFFVALVAASALIWSGCTHNFGTTPTAATRTVSSVSDLNAPWAFDPGPNPETEMGKELIDIVASQPYMPGISEEMTGSQKFRPAFGPTLWRMIQQPNSIKILFIGQDGTHIAEAAGRTATAGFGGRAQDMAAHFGVNNSAAFINAFAFTIKGQYSGAGTPVITETNGQKSLSYTSVVDNGIWLMSQDVNSPMAKWRNRLIDWIIRNNKDSLRLVVLFGGAAQDSIGSFIESRGGKVGSRYSVEDLIEKKVKVPVVRATSAGSNKEVSIPISKNDRDMYKEMGFNIDYRNENSAAQLKQAQDKLKAEINRYYRDLAIVNGGAGRSGIIHPAQIGGYDLTKIEIDGKKTISLKGLTLSDGSRVSQDVLVAEFPHPTYLSATKMERGDAAVAQLMAKSLDALKPYANDRSVRWNIEADPGMENSFAKGQPYKYGRADIGPAFYDFGTPKNRMVSVSSASRLSPDVVLIGTRDKVQFDNAKMQLAKRGTPAMPISTQEMFSSRPRTNQSRYVFDRGPSEKMARIMKENINVDLIGKMKNGKKASDTCKTPEPASQFNIKSHPYCVGDFGHYRGVFQDAQVLIVADPDGVDDILTSRALTGTRGQYLHGLMQDMGINDKYFVLKTVPFAMDGATEQEWSVVLGQTSDYRAKVIAEMMANNRIKLVIADGAYAAREVAKLGLNIPVVNIRKSGLENGSGIQEAAAEIARLNVVGRFTAKGQMANIPRSHLGFFSRIWEGTSGSRVLDASSDADKGSAYAIVVPEWVYKQRNVVQSTEERQAVDKLKRTIQEQGLPNENESFMQFLQRGGQTDSSHWYLNYEDMAA